MLSTIGAIGDSSELCQVKSEEWDGVHPKFFAPEAWKGINDNVGSSGYRKFLQLMVRRIARNKSDLFEEIVPLARLICTQSNWEFMRLALPYLPDLGQPHTGAEAHTQMHELYILLKTPFLNRCKEHYVHNNLSGFQEMSCLTNDQLRTLMGTFFGFENESMLSEQQLRFFKSYVEAAYDARTIADTLEKCKGEMLWNVMGLPSDLRLHKKPGEKKIKKRDLTFIHPFLSHTQWRRDGELSSSDEESDGPSTGSRGAPYGKTQPHAQPAKSIRPSKHGMVLNPRPKLIKTNSTRSITTNQVVAATRLNRIQPVPLTTAQPEGNVNGESSKNQKHMHKCSKYILTQSPDLSTIPESCSSRSQSQAATEELTADTKNDETTAEEDGWSDIANVSRSDRKKKQKASPNGTVDTKAPSASTSRQENDEPAPPAIRHVNFDPLIPHVKKPTIAAAISSHDRPAPPPTNGISESLARLELNGEVQRVRKQPQQAINTQNCPYYLGRPNPGPGDAPPESRQIGFHPEKGAWKYLYEIAGSPSP